MNPTTPHGQNANFHKPPKWDDGRDGPCGILPMRVEQRGIYNYHFSAWKPTTSELAILNAGGVVELCCIGSQPPVSLQAIRQMHELNLEATK